MNRSTNYTISELADAAGITPRTVRFYTAEGLLPPPDSRGKFALYSEEHLDTLRLINRLKEAYLPLGTIRERLNSLSTAEISGLLAEAQNRPVVDSINYLLVHTSESGRRRIADQGRTSENDSSVAVLTDRHRGIASPYSELRRAADTETSDTWSDPEPDRWQRILLASGVELHVHLPMTNETRSQLNRLLDEARRIFHSPM